MLRGRNLILPVFGGGHTGHILVVVVVVVVVCDLILPRASVRASLVIVVAANRSLFLLASLGNSSVD